MMNFTPMRPTEPGEMVFTAYVLRPLIWLVYQFSPEGRSFRKALKHVHKIDYNEVAWSPCSPVACPPEEQVCLTGTVIFSTEEPTEAGLRRSHRQGGASMPLTETEREQLRVDGLRGAWAASDERLTRLAAAVESIVASRERAAAEKAWDEGVGYMAERCVDEHGISANYRLADNPYRAGEIRNG